jgi:hypothetical protein
MSYPCSYGSSLRFTSGLVDYALIFISSSLVIPNGHVYFRQLARHESFSEDEDELNEIACDKEKRREGVIMIWYATDGHREAERRWEILRLLMSVEGIKQAQQNDGYKLKGRELTTKGLCFTSFVQYTL